MSLLDQFPHLSAYDPGATGEGGLDPLGLGAIADRIANMMVPGLRARMDQPRFVTLSAIGAFACETLHGMTADEGKTTADIAFEWMVVEAFVRYPMDGRTNGVPGNQKAQHAIAVGKRLSHSTYLNGPRVFGFTGVYRPFSRDAGILTLDDRPDTNANKLVEAWERDLNLQGYADNSPGSKGGRLRLEITKACQEALEKGACTAPPMGALLKKLSDTLAPREAGENERESLHKLITTGEHEIRNELAHNLVAECPPAGIPQRDLALELMRGVSLPTRHTLQAAFDYEEAATALDHCFREFLAYATRHSGSAISPTEALSTPGLEKLAGQIGGLAQQAIDSVAELGNDGLSSETANIFSPFSSRLTAQQFLERLMERHHMVQKTKRKIPWFDQVGSEWVVRTPYRNQDSSFDEKNWMHPMRLVTLNNFIKLTA